MRNRYNVLEKRGDDNPPAKVISGAETLTAAWDIVEERRKIPTAGNKPAVWVLDRETGREFDLERVGGQYVDLLIYPGGMTVIPTPEGVEYAADLEGGDEGSLFEDHVGNGWDWIPPKAIGTLTDAPILSRDFTLGDDSVYIPVTPAAKVYVCMSYEVKLLTEECAAGRSTYWVESAVSTAE